MDPDAGQLVGRLIDEIVGVPPGDSRTATGFHGGHRTGRRPAALFVRGGRIFAPVERWFWRLPGMGWRTRVYSEHVVGSGGVLAQPRFTIRRRSTAVTVHTRQSPHPERIDSREGVRRRAEDTARRTS